MIIISRPFKAGTAVVKEEILEERRAHDRAVESWNGRLRELQKGDDVSVEMAAGMLFKPLVPIQLKRSDIPRILVGRVGETDPKKQPFSYSFSREHIQSAYEKIGFTPATWRDMTNSNVRRTLANTETANTVDKVYERHLAACGRARAEGYAIDHMVMPKPVWETGHEPHGTFEERIKLAAKLKLNGISEYHIC